MISLEEKIINLKAMTRVMISYAGENRSLYYVKVVLENLQKDLDKLEKGGSGSEPEESEGEEEEIIEDSEKEEEYVEKKRRRL